MNTFKIWEFAAAWSAFHFVLLLFRLPFSEERVGRLKHYGIGILFVVGTVTLHYIDMWVMGQTWFTTLSMVNPTESVRTIFLVIVVMAGIVLNYAIMVGLIFGHCATMWGSWISDDSNIWNETH